MKGVNVVLQKAMTPQCLATFEKPALGEVEESFFAHAKVRGRFLRRIKRRGFCVWIGHEFRIVFQRILCQRDALLHRRQFARGFSCEQLRDSFADGFVGVERWKQFLHVHPQDLSQIAKLAVADMHELRFHFRNSAPADIPAGKLQVNGEIGLRPTPLAPQPADDRSN